MITVEKLYAATTDGLDILALHCPEVIAAAKTKNKFRLRPGEKTPSASVKLFTSKQGFKVWKITDFGIESKAIDPISLHMQETGLGFAEAISDLSSIFNIPDEQLNKAVNRPDIRKQPATAEQEDGKTYWEIDQEFTPEECAIMGPLVTAGHLKALHWHRVKVLISVKNREAVYKYSNENYPIFMRECWFTDKAGKNDRFYKIYEPLNAEKKWRFQYQPAGKKPQHFINGLFELAQKWVDFNDKEEKLFNSDPANEGKVYKTQKLPETVICSGERDSICVRSLGYNPLWFNSETYQLSDEEWYQINKYVDKVYNIPDIDPTGIRVGSALALRFIDINTIWLPGWLATYRDNRGRQCKDFRDWMKYRKKKSDFRELLELATPSKFWKIQKNEKTGATKYSIDVVCLHEFLRLNGFFVLKQEISGSACQFIKIDENIVCKVTPREIRAFVYKWATDTGRPRDLRNLILTTPTLSSVYLEAMPEIDPDFSCCTKKSQIFYFPKFHVQVTAEGIEAFDNKTSSTGKYVWEDAVIGHDIRLLPDMFRITHPEGCYESEDFNIEVLPHNSNFFRYLINSSRIYWRKELETNLLELSDEEANHYRQAHKFDIAGEGLTLDEIQEQKQCLINKIFTIGYMLHRYKDEARAWAPFVMDNVIGENDQCNGRSGKSFMFRAMSEIVPWLKLSGRNRKLLENTFAFEQVRKKHAFVLVDDCDEYMPFQQFYDNITSEITINEKNVSAYNLKFAESPKFAFTTNYVPKEFDPSSIGRMIFVVFSDYYHQLTEENDYLENRSIAHDFNKTLLDDNYSESEWEADINFMMQCVRFYLSLCHLTIKIQPRITNIIFRKHLRDMSENFREWAEGYFSVDENGNGDNVNKELIREQVYESYKRFSGVNKITMQKFTKQLKGFCYTCEYIDSLNPEDMHTSGKRILRRIEDPTTHAKVQKEMIYLRTVQEAERLKKKAAAPKVVETPLFETPAAEQQSSVPNTDLKNPFDNWPAG